MLPCPEWGPSQAVPTPTCSFRKNFGLGDQSRDQERAAFEVIRREHKLLGPMNFAEKAVTFLFVLLVVLWFTREPGFFTGWGNLAFSDENGKR